MSNEGYHTATTNYRGQATVRATLITDEVIIEDLISNYDIDASLPIYQLQYHTSSGLKVSVNVGATAHNGYNEGHPLYTQDFNKPPFNYIPDEKFEFAAYDMLAGAVDTLNYIERYCKFFMCLEDPIRINHIILCPTSDGTVGGNTEWKDDTAIITINPLGYNAGTDYHCPGPYNLSSIAHEIGHALYYTLTPFHSYGIYMKEGFMDVLAIAVCDYVGQPYDWFFGWETWPGEAHFLIYDDITFGGKNWPRNLANPPIKNFAETGGDEYRGPLPRFVKLLCEGGVGTNDGGEPHYIASSRRPRDVVRILIFTIIKMIQEPIGVDYTVQDFANAFCLVANQFDNELFEIAKDAFAACGVIVNRLDLAKYEKKIKNDDINKKMLYSNKVNGTNKTKLTIQHIKHINHTDIAPTLDDLELETEEKVEEKEMETKEVEAEDEVAEKKALEVKAIVEQLLTIPHITVVVDSDGNVKLSK